MSKEKSPLQLGLEELKENGYEYRIHSYSGRGMFGKSCLAIAGDFDPIEIGFYLGKTPVMENEDFPPVKEDQMGRGILLYWPRVKYVEEEKIDCGSEDDGSGWGTE